MSKTHKRHNENGGGFLEDQRNFFDELITEDWDTYKNSEWDRARQVEVFSILQRVPMPEKILDVGCGCGYHDIILANNENVKKVVGIDYSMNSISKANLEYSHQKVKRFVADIFNDLPQIEKEGPFDLVCSFQVIEHLSNPVEFLTRCKVLVKRGGYIAIVTPNYHKLQNVFLKLSRKPVKFTDPLHYAEYSIKDLKLLGRKAGLSYFTCFGRGLSLVIGKHTIIKPQTKIEINTVKMFPGISDVIGIIFTL